MSPAQEQIKPFNVLAIDGGGVRGLYTAVLLQSLARHFFRPISCDEPILLDARFGLVAGTSTGGILACGIASGKSIQALVELYREIGPKVFVDPQPSAGLELLGWAMRHWSSAANSSEPLRETLTKIFGSATLGDVHRKSGVALCLPSCRMLDYSPKVFKTPHSPEYTRDQYVTIVDACMATTAAPIFLPVASIKEQPDYFPSQFVDGGLWANNPTMVALVEAIELCRDKETGKLKCPIRILSVGTSGGASGDRPGITCDRGLYRWKFGGEAAGMSIDVQGGGTHQIASRLVSWFNLLGLDIRYGRIPNPAVTDKQAAELKLDRATPTALKLLQELGDKQAQEIQSESARGTQLGLLVKDILNN